MSPQKFNIKEKNKIKYMFPFCNPIYLARKISPECEEVNKTLLLTNSLASVLNNRFLQTHISE